MSKLPSPVCKWAQRDNMCVLTVPLTKFKYHRLQITSTKMWFIGVLNANIDNNIVEIDHEFLHEIDPAKSGKKIAA